MRIVDSRNCVYNVVLNTRGTDKSLLRIEWDVDKTGCEDYSILGFIICYIGYSTKKECLDKLQELDELSIREIVELSRWVDEPERIDEQNYGALMKGVDIGAIAQGFTAMSSYFRAPCTIEIWTVAVDGEGELCLLCEKSKKNTIYRKLKLRYDVELVKRPVASSSLTSRILKRFAKPEEPIPAVSVRICKEDRSSVYKDGAVSYYVKGQEFGYPITEKMLGNAFTLQNVSPREVRLAISDSSSNLYELEEDPEL